MKELTIEEKAKKYDEAIKKAKYYYDEGKTLEYANDIVSDIFSELKESEDERIRKETISALKYANHKGVYDKHIAWLEKQSQQKPTTIDVDKMVMEYSQTKDGDFGLPVNCMIRAYKQGINDTTSTLNLEKQGEQKPTDKVEPKFHEGEWVFRKFLRVLARELTEVKPTEWSKEDERLCQCLIKDQEEALNNVKNDKYGHSEIISDLKEMYRERIDWLKSLKECIKNK